ncbi:MAG: YXWGXW repeat-containing protein [Steroidobacteraceae bacterium]
MRNRFLRGLIPALALTALAAIPAVSSAGVFVGVSVNIAPPPLPVYVQPPCPQSGYIWAPGYWGWNDGAYYWIPGTWVLPPQVGLLWTPGYWGWNDGAYLWHTGYWGPHVGFYGGVNYGFGYDGAGFVGGYWRRGVFFYNRAVVHVGPTFVTNVYYRPVVYRSTHEHVSYNGGPRGIAARPTHAQLAFAHERHIGFTPVQQRQQRMAFADRSLRADYNHGRPPIAATARPAQFHGRGAFPARDAGAPVHFAPRRGAAIRSDRPSWATDPGRAGRSFERTPRQRFESRPQSNFQQRGSQPMQRQARPEPQHHGQFRPQQRAPAVRGGRREQPRGAAARRDERPHAPPQDHHGGGRER